VPANSKSKSQTPASPCRPSTRTKDSPVTGILRGVRRNRRRYRALALVSLLIFFEGGCMMPASPEGDEGGADGGLREDASPATDGGATRDSGAPSDGGPPSDGGESPDGCAVDADADVDASSPLDDATTADATTADASAPEASADGNDGTVPEDATADAATTSEDATADVAVPADGNTADGSIVPADAGPDAEGSDASGEASTCSLEAAASNSITVSPTSGSGSPLMLMTDCAGDPASPVQLTVTNSGASPVTWTASTTPPFVVVSQTGTTLAPGESGLVVLSSQAVAPPASFSVGFGQLTIDGTFAGGDCPGPATQEIVVPLQETVNGCFVTPIPATLDFGNVPVSTVETMQVPIPLVSCGGFDALATPELGGPQGSPFISTGNNGRGFPIEFRPTTPGPQSATFQFTILFLPAPICDTQNLMFTATGTGTP
jgi:hypothetical protein